MEGSEEWSLEVCNDPHITRVVSTTLPRHTSEENGINIQTHKKRGLNLKWFCICCEYKD